MKQTTRDHDEDILAAERSDSFYVRQVRAEEMQ